MAAYGANAEQTIQPGGYVVFESTIIPCDLGLIQHFNQTPLFSLSGRTTNSGCCCNRNNPVFYNVKFNANVALATGATVDPIAVAIVVDGIAYPISEMDATPAAVGDYSHISTDLPVPILNTCCQNIAIQNIGTQPITMKNAIISFSNERR